MPPTLSADYYVKINGSPVSEAWNQAMHRLEVDANLYLPDMCTIELHDPDLAYIDDAQIAIGKPIEVAVKIEAQETATIFRGEITRIEADFAEDFVTTTIIRAYDLAHRLHRSQKTRSWNNVTDSDVIKKIAQENGLTAQVGSTNNQHEYLVCDNKTDYEFIADLARKNGFAFMVEDKKLRFEKFDDLAGGTVALKYGDTLLEFRPAVSVAAQPSTVVVRGWDPGQKQAVVGQQTSTPFEPARIGLGQRGSAIGTSAFGSKTVTIADRAIEKQAEADALAGGLLTHMWSTDITGEGRAFGNGKIKPGCRVELDGLGTRFKGSYFVTRARHIIDVQGGYMTEFGIAGLSADTTADRITGGVAAEITSRQEVTRGLAVAIVTNVNDPEDVGRVKLKFPWLDEATESTWAPVVTIGAGNQRGIEFLPEVNDEVAVMFLHGDPNHPFVLGGLWNGKDKPPLTSSEAAGTGGVKQRVIVSRTGHRILLDDTDNAEKIVITDKSNALIVTLDSKSPGKIRIESGGDIEVEAKANLKLSGMNVSIEAKTKLEAKGAQVEIDGSGTVKIAAPAVQIN